MPTWLKALGVFILPGNYPCKLRRSLGVVFQAQNNHKRERVWPYQHRATFGLQNDSRYHYLSVKSTLRKKNLARISHNTRIDVYPLQIKRWKSACKEAMKMLRKQVYNSLRHLGVNTPSEGMILQNKQS